EGALMGKPLPPGHPQGPSPVTAVPQGLSLRTAGYLASGALVAVLIWPSVGLAADTIRDFSRTGVLPLGHPDSTVVRSETPLSPTRVAGTPARDGNPSGLTPLTRWNFDEYGS